MTDEHREQFLRWWRDQIERTDPGYDEMILHDLPGGPKLHRTRRSRSSEPFRLEIERYAQQHPGNADLAEALGAWPHGIPEPETEFVQLVKRAHDAVSAMGLPDGPTPVAGGVSGGPDVPAEPDAVGEPAAGLGQMLDELLADDRRPVESITSELAPLAPFGFGRLDEADRIEPTPGPKKRKTTMTVLVVTGVIAGVLLVTVLSYVVFVTDDDPSTAEPIGPAAQEAESNDPTEVGEVTPAADEAPAARQDAEPATPDEDPLGDAPTDEQSAVPADDQSVAVADGAAFVDFLNGLDAVVPGTVTSVGPPSECGTEYEGNVTATLGFDEEIGLTSRHLGAVPFGLHVWPAPGGAEPGWGMGISGAPTSFGEGAPREYENLQIEVGDPGRWSATFDEIVTAEDGSTCTQRHELEIDHDVTDHHDALLATADLPRIETSGVDQLLDAGDPLLAVGMGTDPPAPGALGGLAVTGSGDDGTIENIVWFLFDEAGEFSETVDLSGIVRPGDFLSVQTSVNTFPLTGGSTSGSYNP